MKSYFLKTNRLGFGHWNGDTQENAYTLWQNTAVCRYITLKEQFSDDDVKSRLQLEKSNYQQYGVQYFPVFQLEDNDFVGCCGLRPYGEEVGAYELGFHLLDGYWGKGMGKEAAIAMITYGFDSIGARKIVAGHHPENQASQKLLLSLNFVCTGTSLYSPTGLYHPTYEISKPCGETSTLV